MSCEIRNKAILKAAAIAVFAAMFCVGCGDKNTGDGDKGLSDTTFIITFDPTGGTVTPKSGTVFVLNGVYSWDDALKIMPTPIRSGYIFKGWYTAEGGHGHEVTHTASGDPIFRKNSTLYAHWTFAHYRITFDAHNGTVTPAFDTTGDDWRLALLPTPARDDLHEFGGWYTALTGGELVTVDKVYRADATLYAHWIYTGVHYTITFNSNGGGAVDPATEETDAGGKLQDLPTPTRNGYAFKGWFTAATGGTAVTISTVFSAAATIYAQWTAITSKMYTVTFEAHGGTVTPASGITGEDGKLLASLPTPKRDGYTFNGWFTENAAVTASTVFTANATIHAQWTIIHYTITFNAAGGTVTPTTAKTSSHWELADLPTPTRSGDTFRGWYTAETGGTQVTTSTALMGNITIYAHWTSNSARFTITFDANGGTVTPASAMTGEGFKLASLPTPTRDGYTFHGWYAAETGDTHVTTFTVFESDATIYAHWVAIVHGGTVTYGGETYQTEVIGTQTWFARNLNYAVEGSKCYGQDGVVLVEVIDGYNHRVHEVTLSAADVQANCAKYGRLYDWNAAISACPAGWHLPSDAEWATLINFVGGSSVAGLELRSSSDWEHHGDIVVGADDYGFSALPGGQGFIQNSVLSYRYGDGWIGQWWSSTEWSGGGCESCAWVWYTSYQEESMRKGQYDKRNILNSVRCVKN